MTTTASPRMNRRVYKALDRPLRLCGVDRRLFFLALLVGAAAFNLFYSFLAGGLLFGVLYAGAWWATATDDRMLESGAATCDTWKGRGWSNGQPS